MGINMKKLINEIDAADVVIRIDGEVRKEIQKHLLNMYVDILNVCKKEKIIPYLVGGSCLGAIRHHGFIPWDDDFDIGMTRKDYNKFKAKFEKLLGKDYILSAPNYKKDVKERFPKVFKKGTIYRGLFDDESNSPCNGLFIDIFIIDNVPDNLLLRAIKGTACECLEFISGRVGMYRRTSPRIKKIIKSKDKKNYYLNFITGAFFSPLGSDFWFNLVDKVIQYKKDTTQNVTLGTGRKHYFGEVLNRKELLPAIWVPFENIVVPVFRGYDLYLSNLYGDYMVIPPANKREQHYITEMKL